MRPRDALLYLGGRPKPTPPSALLAAVLGHSSALLRPRGDGRRRRRTESSALPEDGRLAAGLCEGRRRGDAWFPPQRLPLSLERERRAAREEEGEEEGRRGEEGGWKRSSSVSGSRSCEPRLMVVEPDVELSLIHI